MTSRIVKNPRARIVALAVGLGVMGSLATAPASFAAGQGPKPPAIGTNCQTDGKISGRGSTFQANALNQALIVGYNNDVCGPVGSASNLQTGWTSDPAGANMVAYNYTGAKTGSGAGLVAISCRTDAFAGTDLPYNNNQLTGINGAPGQVTGGVAPSYSCPNPPNNGSTLPPYPPVTSPYPNSADATAPAMNFPIAGGAVAIAVNLNGVCTTVPAAPSLNITSDEFEKIWQGTINQWNDPRLVATNPILSTSGCSGNIQRVVRFDNSGTSAITKNDLFRINSGPMCDNPANTWASLANTVWPLGCSDTMTPAHIAPNPVDGGSNGSPALISKLNATNGGIGYAELGLWGTLPAGVGFANLESRDGTVSAGLTNDTPPASAFTSAGTTNAASNCVPGVNGLPGGGTANAAVGLGGLNANWANDSTNRKDDITYQGPGYPVCGLTWDFVYTGMHNETGETAGTPTCPGATITGACQTVQGPMIGTTNDQLRTLYSFFTYVFSPLGQSYLDAKTYDELPASWLPALRSGFQFNY